MFKINKYYLIKINLIIFLFSFIFYNYLEFNSTMETSSIIDITNNNFNQIILIKAKLININKYNKSIILKLNDNSSKNINKTINGIIFKNEFKYNNFSQLKINSEYNVIGKVNIFKNKTQLIIKKLILLNTN